MNDKQDEVPREPGLPATTVNAAAPVAPFPSGSRSTQTQYPWLREIPLITEEAVGKVSLHLSAVAKGRDVDMRSPLYGGAPRQEILARWQKILQPIIADNALLSDFEASNAKKDSPMSVMLPYAERAQQVESYFTNPGGNVSQDTLKLACDAVKEYINFSRIEGRLRPLSLEDACDRLPSNTSWGLPFALRGVVRPRRRREKGPETETAEDVSKEVVDNRPKYLELAKEMSNDFGHPGWQVPCMLYWRGDLGKEGKTKQRVVWGYPHAVSILESAYYSVLTEVLKGVPGFAAWTDLLQTEAGVFAVLEGSSDETPVWAFDASAFDQHLSSELIDAVCDNIIIPAFQRGNEALLKQLSLYSKQCGIVTPDGVKTGRNFNRPSGSGGTNLLDCLENMVMYAAFLLHRGVAYSDVVKILKQVMGDDAVYGTVPGFSLEEAKTDYLELFGAVVNEDKENLSSQFTTFCKRLYARGETHSWASTVRALMKAVSYERATPDVWNKYCDSVRWIMQLNPLESHPAFQQIVDFVADGDELALGLNLPGGVLELFKLAGDSGRVDLDQVLGLKAWANEYTGFSTKDARNLPVVRYLLSKDKAGSSVEVSA